MCKIYLCLIILFASLDANETLYGIKGGFLAHSTGPVSSGRESGTDIHAELLFKEKFLSAYPSIGVDINLQGGTSFLYTGLSWEDKFFKHIHLGAFFGFAIHNGELDINNSQYRQFGTRFLFREALDIGVYLKKDLSLSLMYDHYSNAGLDGQRNQGNDNIGLRFSYFF